MKKLALTTLIACLLAAPALAAPPEAAVPGVMVIANCPGKPPVNA